MKTRRPLALLLSLQILILWVVEEKTLFFKPKTLAPISGAIFCVAEVVSPTLKKEKATEFVVDLLHCSDKPIQRAVKKSFLRKQESKGSLWIPAFAGMTAKGGHFFTTPIQARAKINVFGEAEELFTGDLVRFRASFRLPKDFQNPGAFQLTRYTRSQGIDLLGSISEPAWIARSPRQSEVGWGEKVRRQIRRAVLKSCPEKEGGFLLALLMNESHRLPSETAEAFRQTGVAHIIAISGLHITLVTLLLLGFFRVLFSFPPFSRSVFISKYFYLLAIPLVWIYIAVAHYPVSGVRAGVMATLILIGLTLWRKLDFLSALYLAAFLILSLNPLALFQASFQFSFMAILFLILFYPRWLALQKGWLLNSCAVSFIALSGVGPLLLFHFHQFSFVGLFANLICVPWASFLLMPLGLLGWLLTGIFGLELSSFWFGVGWLAKIFIQFVEWLARHSEWGVFYGSISFWQILFYYGACFLFLISKETLSLKKKMAPAIVLLLLVLWGGKMPPDGKLRITFVDVGQGDCAVVQLPNGKVWVVDGGGIRGSDWDVGRFIVAPVLWSTGIHHVEYLFLTHPHHDHYKGLGFLAEQFGPKVLFVNGDSAPEAEALEWQTFLKRVEKGGVQIQKVTRRSPPIESAGVHLEFLMPGPDGTLPHFDVNDNSVVMKLQFRGVSFLLSGDLMEMGETTLLESKPDLKADVLKAGHHGSETSTTEDFLKAVAPKYAVISVGAYNSYGMPDPVVLRNLEAKGVQTFRTDLHGAVTFTTDGEQIDVQTFVP